MEAETALIRTDGAVELNPVTGVHPNLAFVIHPGHSEHDSPLGGGQPLQQSIAPIGIFILFNDNPQGLQYFINGLVEFRLVGVLLFDPFEGFVYIAHIDPPLLINLG